MDELLTLLLLALFAGAGAFLGSYLKRKGENLATHEDIHKLVVQVRAVTEATKEIEAKISDEVWDRQKRWELKREVLFEATKGTALVKNALTALHAFYQTEKDSPSPGSLGRSEARLEALTKWNEAANSLDQTTFLVGLVCAEELKELLLRFSLFVRRLANEITRGKPEAFVASADELAVRWGAITAAMRKELGIEPSSEASPSSPPS
jgi:hypothetical protein